MVAVDSEFRANQDSVSKPVTEVGSDIAGRLDTPSPSLAVDRGNLGTVITGVPESVRIHDDKVPVVLGSTVRGVSPPTIFQITSLHQEDPGTIPVPSSKDLPGSTEHLAQKQPGVATEEDAIVLFTANSGSGPHEDAGEPADVRRDGDGQKVTAVFDQAPESLQDEGDDGAGGRNDGGLLSPEDGENESRGEISVLPLREARYLVTDQEMTGKRIIITLNNEPSMVAYDILPEDIERARTEAYGEATFISRGEFIGQLPEISDRAVLGEKFVVQRWGVPGVTVQDTGLSEIRNLPGSIITRSDVRKKQVEIFEEIENGQPQIVTRYGSPELYLERADPQTLYDALRITRFLNSNELNQAPQTVAHDVASGERYIIFTTSGRIVRLEGIDLNAAYQDTFDTSTRATCKEFIHSQAKIEEKTADGDTLLTLNGVPIWRIQDTSSFPNDASHPQVTTMSITDFNAELQPPTGTKQDQTIHITHYDRPKYVATRVTSAQVDQLYERLFTNNDPPDAANPSTQPSGPDNPPVILYDNHR